VTGVSAGGGSGDDYATIKYAPNGDTLWVRRYNGPGNYHEWASALAVDASGNVFVTGNSGGDYATIKYASNGDTLWVRRANGSGSGAALTLDVNGNVYVTGTTVTIKYFPNGDTAWIRSNGFFGRALAVDSSGNVYVTGSIWNGTSFDYATVKYTPNGDTLWVRHYNGPGDGSDLPSRLAVDGSGNVYVTGNCFDSVTGVDYATIKYSPDGDTLWVRRFHGPSNGGIDAAYGLAVDDGGNVYVTGVSQIVSGSFSGYATIKYAPNGDILWLRRYDGPGNSIGIGKALILDDSANVYVTGWSVGNGTAEDCVTIKYTSNGDTIWVKRYNGPANPAGDKANTMALDDSGNVYIAGESGISGESATLGYVTIKYVQFTCEKKPGDANGSGGSPNLTDIIYLVNYIFKEWPATTPTCLVDVNGSGSVGDIIDLIYLINYVYKGGPAPVKSRECCL